MSGPTEKSLIHWGHTFERDCGTLLFVSLIQARVLWEEGSSIEKRPPSERSVDKSTGNFLGHWLMGEGSAHCEWCHPWACGCGLFKKAGRVGETCRESQQAALHHGFCSSSCLQVPSLPDGLWIESWNKPFTSLVAFSHGPYHNNRKKTETTAHPFSLCSGWRSILLQPMLSTIALYAVSRYNQG